jgi:hypothetical protein
VTTEDIEDIEEPSDNELAQCSNLAEAVRAAEREVIEATSALNDALQRLKQLQEIELPAAMRDVNMNAFTLGDGTPVRLHTRLLAGQLTDEKGLQWVTDNGGDSLVKATVTVEFDRNDIQHARAAYEDLRTRWGNVAKRCDLRQAVHPQTLIHWVGELLAEQGNPPLELLGVHRHIKALVGAKLPKSFKLTGLAQKDFIE